MEQGLAVVEPPGQLAPQPAWGRDRIDLIKRTICPKGISDDEFALFIEQCKRSGLDPLLKEAFCVPRRQNVGSREKPNWVNKHEFQPSEAGMLARAERFPDFKGIQASAAYAEDELLVDQGKGEVTHRFNPAKRKGGLVGAWARVVRQGKLPVVVWLDFAGYVQQTPLWLKIPTTMIEKCARVAALRKAYPEAFGGFYVREEMPPEEFGEKEPAGYEPLGAPQEQPKASLPAVSVTTALDAPVPRETAPATPAPSPGAVVAFGPNKGKAIAELSDEELSETIELAHEKLQEQPKAKWARAMRENLAALEAATELRCRVPTAAGAKKEPQPFRLSVEDAEKKDLSKETVGFGKWKGMVIGAMTVEEIQECAEWLKDRLESPEPMHGAAVAENTLLLLGVALDRKMTKAGVPGIV